MRLLLDTHVLVWWLTDDPKLSVRARRAVADPENEVFVSAASIWEPAIKARSQRVPMLGEIADRAEALLEHARFSPLDIGVAHARLAGALPVAHRDPFDRMLAAQARIERLTLATSDRQLRRLVPHTLW